MVVVQMIFRHEGEAPGGEYNLKGLFY
jgi:hypothetical protein